MVPNFFKTVRESALIRDIVNLLFPCVCVLCGRRGVWVCLLCRQSLPPTENDDSLSEEVRSVFCYRDNSVKHIIWLLKYKNAQRLASFCAEALYEQILEDMSDCALFQNFTNPVLVPIPLSKKRLRFRGYNQAECIVHELVRLYPECKVETRALYKVRETKPQMTIQNKKERLKNIVGCFAVKHPERVHGQNIILIDDITTTGATLNEARKVLRGAGAKNVIAYTVAH